MYLKRFLLLFGLYLTKNKGRIIYNAVQFNSSVINFPLDLCLYNKGTSVLMMYAKNKYILEIMCAS
jgi:hypothetical protein